MASDGEGTLASLIDESREDIVARFAERARAVGASAMLPEGMERTLFDPFVQIGADRSGFGLGLAIAKQVADAHDGQLRVHSVAGKGCIFVLDLPAPAPEPAA